MFEEFEPEIKKKKKYKAIYKKRQLQKQKFK